MRGLLALGDRMACNGCLLPLCVSRTAAKAWLVLSTHMHSAFTVAHTNRSQHAAQLPAHGYLYLSPNQDFVIGLEDVPQ